MTDYRIKVLAAALYDFTVGAAFSNLVRRKSKSSKLSYEMYCSRS